ncbi:hypothetical protein [Rahnella victoriana]|uniref:hypothetical protein n=1 Tax=Rahnella victoriana TaxID=1510570 RepID=UPI00103B3208|nr:hypothetical protein [Rahnella victoriana]TBX31623.1 hypothetical protein EYY67_21595 [Rahnella victoriana]
MKLLQNEFEYRAWMTDDYLQHDGSPTAVMTQYELERELLRMLPASFPSLVYLAYSGNPDAPEKLVFISRHQVAEWAAAMGLS